MKAVAYIAGLLGLALLVWLVKPGFVARKDLFVGEGVDLSQFTAGDEFNESRLVQAK